MAESSVAGAADLRGASMAALASPPSIEPGRSVGVEPRAGHSAPRRALANDPSALRDRLLEVLAYATDGLARLDRHAELWPAEKHRGGGDDALLRRVDKVAAEGLLLAYLASRVAGQDAELGSAVTALVDGAEARLATGRSEAVLRRFPQATTTLGLSYVLLGQLGRGRPEIEELLRRRLASGWATVNERAPYRLMDSRWTFGLFDPSLLGPPEALLPFCTLAADPHPIWNLNEDDYALTHAIFYLTDFGRRPAPPEIEDRAAQLLDPFLAWHSVQLDLDLLGEMLIAALALRMPPTAALELAWEVFASAWEEGGLVGPEHSAAKAAELRGAEREAYEFSENYHTVFVGGILCAVALGRPSWIAKVADPRGDLEEERACLERLGERCKVATLAAEASPMAAYALDAPTAEDLVEWSVARLLHTLEVSLEPPPLWLHVASESGATRDEIARVLHDALLVATARRYRLAQLGEALAVAARHAQLHSPTFRRAWELLLDQQAADGSVGIHSLLAAEELGDAPRAAQRELLALLRAVGAGLASR